MWLRTNQLTIVNPSVCSKLELIIKNPIGILKVLEINMRQNPILKMMWTTEVCEIKMRKSEGKMQTRKVLDAYNNNNNILALPMRAIMNARLWSTLNNGTELKFKKRDGRNVSRNVTHLLRLVELENAVSAGSFSLIFHPLPTHPPHTIHPLYLLFSHTFVYHWICLQCPVYGKALLSWTTLILPTQLDKQPRDATPPVFYLVIRNGIFKGVISQNLPWEASCQTHKIHPKVSLNHLQVKQSTLSHLHIG